MDVISIYWSNFPLFTRCVAGAVQVKSITPFTDKNRKHEFPSGEWPSLKSLCSWSDEFERS